MTTAERRALRRERLKGLPINRMIPNMLTLLALCAGLSSIRFALLDRFDLAALAILVAAIFDGLDGRVARILKGASKFGAELDSLSDFLSFGVAPALTLYLWALRDTGPGAWLLVLFYVMCAALRLARFNTALEDDTPPAWTRNYFTGVPSPAGAGLVLLPLILAHLFGDDPFRGTEAIGFFLVAAGALMVSTLPTFSFKKFKVDHRFVLPMMLFFGLMAATMISAPWAGAATLLILYLASIPLAVRSYRALKKRDAADLAASSDAPDQQVSP
ncbi:MAG: phosphatidylcholine/phosphatidylserine synthase [Magnetospirillum sp. WYHS-4]